MRRRPFLCTAPREKLPSSVFAPLRGDVFQEDNPGGRNLKKSSLVWKGPGFSPFLGSRAPPITPGMGLNFASLCVGRGGRVGASSPDVYNVM